MKLQQDLLKVQEVIKKLCFLYLCVNVYTSVLQLEGKVTQELQSLREEIDKMNQVSSCGLSTVSCVAGCFNMQEIEEFGDIPALQLREEERRQVRQHNLKLQYIQLLLITTLKTALFKVATCLKCNFN